MNQKNIYWTPLAVSSLRETHNFILQHWSYKVGEHFLDLIDERIDQLKINSEIAPKIKASNYRKLVIHKNISLFYINETLKTKILLI